MTRRLGVFLFGVVSLAVAIVASRLPASSAIAVDIPPVGIPVIPRANISQIAFDDGTDGVKALSSLTTSQGAGVRTAESESIFVVFVEAAKPGSIVYVSDSGLQQLDLLWARSQFQRGIVFVGINVSLSSLAQYLDAKATIPDLDMAFARGRSQISVVYRYKDGQGEIGGVMTDFVDNMDVLPQTLLDLIEGHKRS